jgi:hypothetical protein
VKIPFKQINNCPRTSTGLICAGLSNEVTKNNYSISPGWGELNANIIFVAINPSKTSSCKNNKIVNLIEKAKYNFNTDWSDKKFFSFHKQILSKLLKKRIQKINLKKEAFFSEIILCPGPYQNLQKNVLKVARRCTKLFLKNFLMRSKAKVVIALGKEPAIVCKEIFDIEDDSLISLNRPVLKFSNFEPKNDKILICTYHPAWLTRYKKDKIRNRIFKQIKALKEDAYVRS